MVSLPLSPILFLVSVGAAADLRSSHFAVFATLALVIAVLADAFTQDVIHPYEQVIVDLAQGNNTARLARVMNFTIVGPLKDGSSKTHQPEMCCIQNPC